MTRPVVELRSDLVTLEFSTLVGVCEPDGSPDRPKINIVNWATVGEFTVTGTAPAPPGLLDNILTEAGDILTTEASDQLTTES